MSSTMPSHSTPRASQSTSPLLSSPLQPIALGAALETHGNDALPSSPLAGRTRSPLSPADCQTLKKILAHAWSPSLPVSPSHSVEDTTSLGTDSANDGSSDSGDEDEERYFQDNHGRGDKIDAEYEDKDDSTELSDVREETREHVIATDDEAIWQSQSQSILSSKTDESVCVWSDGDTIQDMMNTPGDTAPPAQPRHLSGVYVREHDTRDETKEMNLRRTILEKTVGVECAVQGLRIALAIGDDEFDGDDTTDGAQDVAENLSNDSEIGDAENDVKTAFELEYFEPNSRRTSQLFSPLSIVRRASVDTHLSSSSTTFLRSEPSVVSSPLKLTSRALVLKGPFTKTLNHSKLPKGKERSPSKSRRNASLPDELAELAREASEAKDLEKYREMDLAPMEPVGESDTAGDRITFATPVEAVIPPLCSGNMTLKMTRNKISRLQQLKMSSSGPSLSVERNTERIDVMPSVDEINRNLNPEHPTFVIVIGMLPKALSWATAALFVKYSSKVYDILVKNFDGLELR